jgi:alginate O-acetyltransferase complex protein AlgI
MLFNTFQFIFIFLPISIFGIYIIQKLKITHYSYLWILFCSICFYAMWDFFFLFLIFFTIILNFYLGNLIIKFKKKKYLIFGIIFQLCILGYFKYKNFFLENLNYLTNNSFQIENFILPLGISFFTFKHILYLIECYELNNKFKYNIVEYSTYITFFPHLIAGPLSKPKEILPQIRKINFTLNNFNLGMVIFFIGLFKKVFLADTFASFADDPFMAVENGYKISFVEAWLSMLCFTLQIYFDFSGYTDMALGLAKIFGVTFPINFNSPYKSQSIIEFWSRWHITLSRFLKECVYIPMGGNRKGKYLSFLFILITMLVGGLWHGASWNFVVWGLFHAVLIIFNHILKQFFNKPEKLTYFNKPKKFLKIFITFILINFGWVIFKLNSIESIKIFFLGLFGKNGFSLNQNLERYFSNNLIIDFFNLEFKNTFYYGLSQIYFLIFGLIIVFLLPNISEIMKDYKVVLPYKNNKTKDKVSMDRIKISFNFTTRWAIFIAFVAVCAITGISNDVKEFIYYQF